MAAIVRWISAICSSARVRAVGSGGDTGLTDCETGDIIIARVMPAQPRKPLAENFALSTERLGPLSLVNHFIERLGLRELLDQYVPTTDRRCALPHALALGVPRGAHGLRVLLR